MMNMSTVGKHVKVPTSLRNKFLAPGMIASRGRDMKLQELGLSGGHGMNVQDLGVCRGRGMKLQDLCTPKMHSRVDNSAGQANTTPFKDGFRTVTNTPNRSMMAKQTVSSSSSKRVIDSIGPQKRPILGEGCRRPRSFSTKNSHVEDTLQRGASFDSKNSYPLADCEEHEMTSSIGIARLSSKLVENNAGLHKRSSLGKVNKFPCSAVNFHSKGLSHRGISQDIHGSSVGLEDKMTSVIETTTKSASKKVTNTPGQHKSSTVVEVNGPCFSANNFHSKGTSHIGASFHLEDSDHVAFHEGEHDMTSASILKDQVNQIYDEDTSSSDEEDEGNLFENGRQNEEDYDKSMEEEFSTKDVGPSKKLKTGNEKTRGRNKCKEIAKLKAGQKLQVTFYNKRAVGENHKIFARHLGIIVRDTNICPVRVHKWADIGEKEKEHMWTAVTDIFTNDNMKDHREDVLDHMHELWLNWRADLLRYNVTKQNITLKAALKKVPRGLTADEWKWLITEKYSKESFKKASERNSKNRANYPKPLLHRTGSKPYREVMWSDMGGKDGHKPSLLEIYRETHKKGDSLVNAETAQNTMKYKRLWKKNSSLSHSQVAEKVFESKYRGRVIGYGGGVKPKDLREPYSNRGELEAELNSAKQVNKALWSRVQTLEEQNQELVERVETMEVQMKMLQDVISQKLDVSFPTSPTNDDRDD